MRLVVDMKEVNQFMVQKHFKMEGTPTLQDLLWKKNYLKKAYNYVPLHPTLQDTICGNYIYISGDAIRTEQCLINFYPNNEEIHYGNSRSAV
jgi:hypothetical protein